MSLKDLKKLKKEMLENNKAKMEGKSSFENNVDERFYIPSQDAEGRISVKLRFIPSLSKDEDGDVIAIDSFAKVRYHNISDCGKEKRWMAKTLCPRSIGKDCPVCDHGTEVFNALKEQGQSKTDAGKKAGKWWSQEKFITNILIVEDTEKPENEGKIFLFEFGKEIFNNINAQTNPKNAGDNEYIDEDTDLLDDGQSFDGWDLDSSPIFKLNRTVGQKNTDGKTWKKFPSWAKSKFDIKSFEEIDEKEQEKLMKEAYSLDEFKDAKKYPTKEFLQKKIDFLTYKDSDESSEDVSEKEEKLRSEETKPNKRAEKKVPKKEVSEDVDDLDIDDIDMDDLDSFLND